MTHSFLVEAGRWILRGNWLERNQEPIALEGRTIVAWNQADWFTMATKLTFPKSDLEEISFQYRGRLDSNQQHYTYVLRQSLLGKIEGEGRLAPQSIVQRYWVLSDSKRRSGFDTFYQLDRDTYFLSSGILAGHYLTSTMEAILERQA